MDGTEEKPSPLEQAMRIGQELYGYGHCKIQDENQVFKYTRRCLDRLAIERNQVVPSHYIKHAETVLGENQNTVEKNWSYYTPLYEITDEMQGKLRDAKVDMHLDDAALVIDCWEKVAVNDLVVENKVLPLRDNKAHCISRFRAIHSKRMRGDDLDDRVTEAACARLWEVWLETRESRKHRSLIRMFWVYQDEVGGDNYKTFQRPKIDVKPHNTRKNSGESQAHICFSPHPTVVKPTRFGAQRKGPAPLFWVGFSDIPPCRSNHYGLQTRVLHSGFCYTEPAGASGDW